MADPLILTLAGCPAPNRRRDQLDIMTPKCGKGQVFDTTST